MACHIAQATNDAFVFHCVREEIASKMVVFLFLPGLLHPAHIVSKYWGYLIVWRNLKALLFWQGDGVEIGD
jgi:hypothetical protein